MNNINNNNKFLLDCDCGCSILKFTKEEWDGDTWFSLQYYISGIHTGESFFSKIAGRIKAAWFMLTGKEYLLYDVLLTKERFVELQKYIINADFEI